MSLLASYPLPALPSLPFSLTFLGKSRCLRLCCSRRCCRPAFISELSCPSPAGTLTPSVPRSGLLSLPALTCSCAHQSAHILCKVTSAPRTFSTHFPSCRQGFPLLSMNLKIKIMGVSHDSHFLTAKLILSSSRLSAAFSISFAPGTFQFPLEVNKEDRESEQRRLEAGDGRGWVGHVKLSRRERKRKLGFGENDK